MKIVCAWCKKDMGEKEPKEDERITHAICAGCKMRMVKEMDKNLKK